MTSRWRWTVVAVGTAVLVAAPVALRSLPAADTRVAPATLLERVRSSQDLPWSGYVETEGALQLPDAGRFDDVAALLGERSRMRAWWQDADHWRVDQLLATGESDLVHDGGTTLAWDYERAEARVSRDPDVRLPRTADLLPPVLAARLLRGVTDAQVSGLPAERVAGTSAPGLRVTPSSPLSSIDHVDVWADPATGVPLEVVVDAGGATPSFTSTFLDFSSGLPDAAVVSFERAPGVDLRAVDVLDIADAANQYAPVRPPPTVAGLAKSAASRGAVGVYGSGMTQLIAIPLRDREADDLRAQLAVTRGVADDTPGRTSVAVGPLGVLLTGAQGQGGWLLAGTLTTAGLARAADDVLDGFVYLGESS